MDQQVSVRARTRLHYPFTAIVGQELLKTGLLLNAVDPAVGGLLIRGQKGTAKSTAARALAALLPPIRTVADCPFHCDPNAPWPDCPHCSALAEPVAVERPVPFVDLPLGATEDRVLGTLDLERILREGIRAFQPGLLAAAHRGILYIDEVNLLADHLVDVLLDAAAMGVNPVEREGIAVAHPARFLLVGTMNPEEGELRPQLLDRFGLMVEVSAPQEAEERAEVVRRRLAFDRDPTGFIAAWEPAQTTLRARIQQARDLLPQVTLDEDLLTLIGHICSQFQVEGLRGDIVIYRAACALAALDGRTQVTVQDIRTAAELALPHRRRRQPFEQPGLDRERLDELLAPHEPPPDPESPSPPSETSQPEEPSAPHAPQDPEGEQRFQAAAPMAPPRFQVSGRGRSDGRGRRNPGVDQGRGRYVRAVPHPRPTDPAMDATLRAAARRGGAGPQGVTVQAGDLHQKVRVGRKGTAILFLVDASGSMAARRRMEAVKGAVLGLLTDAYQKRDQVGLIAFRGPRAEILLPLTPSVERAEQALQTLPTGGRTPLAHGLALAGEVLAQARRRDPDRPCLLVVVTDGRANVPLEGGDAWADALQAARHLRDQGIPALVLDTEQGRVRHGRAQALAQALAAVHLPLEQLSAEQVTLYVRRHL